MWQMAKHLQRQAIFKNSLPQWVVIQKKAIPQRFLGQSL